jgi:excisionase family DNA binding protein
MFQNIYTVDKLAACLDVSPQTIRRYIHSGVLQASKIGRKWFIEDVELERILREGIQIEA